MTILKFVPKASQPLEKMWDYLLDSQKTDHSLWFGYGVNPEFLLEQIELTTAAWEIHSDRVPYQQVIISFDGTAKTTHSLNILLNVCKEIGEWIHSQSLGNPIVGILHTNTPYIHCHYLIFRQNCLTGKQFRQAKSLFAYKQEVNKVLQKYGLTEIKCYQGEKREELP